MNNQSRETQKAGFGSCSVEGEKREERKRRRAFKRRRAREERLSKDSFAPHQSE